jgi:hypothetical protein
LLTGTKVQILTLICAGEETKVLAYWYKSTNTDTRRQKCLRTGTKVQILTLLFAGEEMGVAEDALGTRLWYSIYLLY